MASVMLCDSDHEEPTPGFMLVQLLESGEAQVYCGACAPEWLWGMVENLPDYDDRIKARMNVLMEQQANKASNAARKRRKAGLPEADEVKDSDGIAGAESTPTDE